MWRSSGQLDKCANTQEWNCSISSARCCVVSEAPSDQITTPGTD